MSSAALLLLTAALCAPAETGDLARAVDEVLTRWDRDDGPGGAVAILRDGRPVLQRTFGLADLEAGRPVTERTPFYIASLAKPFTAACALHAARTGLLDLDASLLERFPELPAEFQPITLRQAMHHRSGIADVYDVAVATDRGPNAVRSNSAALALIARLGGPDFAPGSRFRYSNSGYVLLAEAVRRASGRELFAYAREHLFEARGMADAAFLGGELTREPAHAYRRASAGWSRLDLPTGMVGPGGMHASLVDLVAFARAPLDPEALRAPEGPHHPRFGPYAGGWMLQRIGGQRAQRHSGGAFGFTSDLIRLPEPGVTVIALSNASDLDAMDLAPELARLALGDAWVETEDHGEGVLDADPAFGRFWIDPESDALWILLPRGKEFEVVAMGDLRLRLVPVTETRLVAPDAQVPFALELEGDGLVVESDGERTVLEPFPFPPLDVRPLADYTGRWVSAPLDAEIVLEERGGRLALRQERPLVELPPFHALGLDTFLCDVGAVLRFQRDEEDRVVAFTFDTKRASGLEFERP